MFYNYYKPSEYEYNDCTAKGACSVSPDVSSFREVMVLLLRQLSYYILKLEGMGAKSDNLKMEIINSIANLFPHSSYSNDEIYASILKTYNNFIQTKEAYQQICKEKDVNPLELRAIIKISSDMNLANLMSLGEKIYRERNKKITPERRQLFEILFIVIKSLATNISQLSDYKKIDDEDLNVVLEALNMLNYNGTSIIKLKNRISDVVELNYSIISQIGDKIYEKFDDINEVTVSTSSRPNKAILVSGDNLSELFELLKQTENNDVDVYTHSDLLIAHALSKFTDFKNLYGHFGSSADNFMLDFATFPGSILLTKNAAKNLDYLYRGRLFSTDKTIPVGLSQIKDNDFTELIDTALKARGFKTGKTREPVVVGYDVETLKNKFNNIASKFNNGEIKHLIIIGLTNLSSVHNDYYNELLSRIPDDTYVISFGAQKQNDNILSINLANNLPMLYRLMNEFLPMLNNDYGRITYFIAKCDANSFSAMVSLKDHGFNNIYLSNCPPTAINPQTLNAFMRLYNIKHTTKPKDDLKDISDTKKGT